MTLNAVTVVTDIKSAAICAMLDGKILVCDKTENLKMLNREGTSLKKDIPIPCKHTCVNDTGVSFLHMKIGYKPYIVYLCAECKEIYLINIISKQATVAWGGELQSWVALAQGPDDTLFASTIGYQGVAVSLDCSREKFKQKGIIKFTNFHSIRGMAFEPNQSTLIASGLTNLSAAGPIEAIKIDTGEPLWEISRDQVGSEFSGKGICCDGQGNVFITDFNGSFVLIVDAKSGRVLRRELQDDEKFRLPTSICCFNDQPKLAVGLYNDNIYICEVQYK